MYTAYYYKITIRFRAGKPKTFIEHFYTLDKKKIEDRLLYRYKRKYKENFHSLDIWLVPESSEEVIAYKKDMDK